jgi:hypothetical protein
MTGQQDYSDSCKNYDTKYVICEQSTRWKNQVREDSVNTDVREVLIGRQKTVQDDSL